MLHFAKSIVLAGLILVLQPGGSSIAQQQPVHKPTWPAPPETARIRFVGFLSQKTDVGAERSFLRKIWDALIGSEEELDFLVQPVGIAVDSKGRIFVADPGAGCVHMFDRNEEEYENMSEGPDGFLSAPVGIAISDDRIYVTDAALKRVIVFDMDLDPEFSFDPLMTRPTGITLLNGHIYIADTGEHRIAVFDRAGNPIRSFGERGSDEGQFNFPVFLTARDNLFVVDAMNHRIQILDTIGTALSRFGAIGNAQGSFASPKGLALDSDGNIYVADALFDAFQIFNPEGQLLLVVGEHGAGAGEFQSPAGICIDQNNLIYVVDTMNRRIQLFQYLERPE